MATMLAEPAFSESTTSRFLTTTATALSAANTLPTLHFGFDDLRARMNNFTQRFDDFIEQGRRRVLEERNQFRMRLAQVQGPCLPSRRIQLHAALAPRRTVVLTTHRLADEQAATHRALAALAAKSAAHDTTLAAHAAEAAEMHAAIDALASTRDAHAIETDKLRASVTAVRAQVHARRAAQREHAAALSQMRAGDAPELERWERALGMRVEAAGLVDRVRFVFDISGAEATCELDMAGVGWDVVRCEPPVERERARRVVDEMRNGEEEDLGGFLRAMRGLFVGELRVPASSSN